MGNNTYVGTGGSGAGFHGIIHITEEGDYTIIVGSGATSVGGDRGYVGTGDTGETSYFKKGNNALIQCGGGTGGHCEPVSAYGGTGGTLIISNSVSKYALFVSSNGNSGNYYAGGSSCTVNPAKSVIPNHNFGASGKAHGNFDGGTSDPSIHGYFMITRKCAR